MKITFLKNHLNHIEGDVVEIEDGIANYLIRVGVAEGSTKEKQEKEDTTEKVDVKPKKKKQK